MPETTPTKRRRGGQPGNKNAKNNRGNKNARGTKGNRGGKGAPMFNRNAHKPRTLESDLFKEFKNDPEASEWIRQNALELSKFEVAKEHDFASSRFKPTVENFANSGNEFRFGIYSNPDFAAMLEDSV